MRTISNKSIFLFAWLLFPVVAFAKTVSISTVVTPPYPREVSAYAYSTQVIVQSDEIIYSASLRVSIKGDNGIIIRTPNNYIPAANFDMNPNIPVILTGSQLSEYFDLQNLTVTGITKSELRQNGLPYGQYKICFRLVDSDYMYQTADDPVGCSAMFRIKEPVTTISTVVAPPFGNQIESYASTTKVIINSEKEIPDASIRISIKGENGIKIFTPTTFYPTGHFDVTANTPVMLTGIQLSEYFDLQNLTVTGANPAALRQTGLPPGQYKICVRLLSSDYVYETGDDPTGCSALFEVRNAEPPQLLTPQCNMPVQFNTVPNILFSWTPAIGAPAFTQYTLKIVEMLDTTVSPANAMQSATTPPFFEQTVTGSYTFLYGPGQPMMDPGKKYAWQVIARDDETNVQFQNEGKSPVCSFTLKKPAMPGVPSISSQTPVVPDMSDTKIPSVLNIPWAVLEGKFEWTFPKTEEGEAVTESPNLFVSAMFNDVTNNPVLDPNVFLPSSPKDQKHTDYFSAGGADMSNVSVSGVSPSVGNIFKQQLSVFEKEQQAINVLAGTEKHPLAKVQIDIHLFIKDEIVQLIKKLNQFPGGLTGTLAKLENDIFIGSVTTDNDGSFKLVFIKPIPEEIEKFYTVDLNIHDEHFSFPTIGIPITHNSSGSYSLGTLNGLADVYRYKPTIKDENGKKIETAKLTIKRSNFFFNFYSIYQNLKWEGSRNPDFLSDVSFVAEGKSTNTFKRMFASDNFLDIYLLTAEAEGFVTKTFFFSAGGNKVSASESGVTLVEQSFSLVANNPVVKGRVICKETELPLSNVTVTVKQEGENNPVYSAQTGADGKFTIADISVSDKPYKLYVNSGLSKEWIDPNPLYLNKKGIIENRDPILVEAQLFTVKGVVANISSQVLSQASVTWASGGKVVFSNTGGLFVTAHPLGKDTLIVSKDGYREARIPVDLKEPSTYFQPNKEVFGKQTIQDKSEGWKKAINTIGGIINASNAGDKTANSFGYTEYNNISMTPSDGLFYDLFGSNQATAPAPVIIDLDTIKLKRFYVQVTVKDADNNSAIAFAGVKTEAEDKPALTNSKGVAVIENVNYGTPVLYIYGPSGSAYIPVQQQFTVSASEDTAKITVKLSKGALVSGKVTSSGVPLEGAKVVVAGMDYIFSLTDTAGNYQLPGLPQGDHTVRAIKSGYIGDEKSQNFTAKNYTINFNLVKPDFDASKLLGFPIQLYHVTAGALPGEFVIDGEFVNLPPNGIFSFAKTTKLEFAPLTVTKNPDGTIQPKDGSVTTLTSNLGLKVFNYLDAVAVSSSGLKVVPQGSNMNKGLITAGVKLNTSSSFFNKTSFIKYPAMPVWLTAGGKEEIAIVSSEGNIPEQPSDYRLKCQSAAFTIYNTTLTANLPECKVNSSGITLKGTVSISNIPGLGNTVLQVEKCSITTSGDLQEVQIGVTPNPVLSLYSWALKIKSATLNQFGFRFGGELNIKIPNTSDLNVSFANLTIGNSAITGGAFYMPVNNNLLGIFKYSSSFGTAFQLGKVPGENAYRLSGTGNIQFSKYLNDDIPLEHFSVATNGGLELKAKTGIEYNIEGVANFNISQVEINTIVPEVSVTGKIALFLPGFNAGAGGKFHFRKNNFASLDDISFKLSLNAIGSIYATTSFLGNGFKGSGKLNIANSSIGEISAGFLYQKISSGLKLEVAVTPGLPPIPLVGTVSLENIGGKVILNTSSNIYSVTLSGRIVVAPGTSSVVSLDPVAVTVTASAAGPVLQGFAITKVVSWNVGNAEFRIDYPQKLLLIKASFDNTFNLLPGVTVGGSSEMVFTASAKSGDSYWLAGAYASMNFIPGLEKGNATVAIGWNLSPSAHPEFNQYTDFIPAEALSNGKINGVNVIADVSMGVKKEDADCANFTIGKICAYAYSNSKGLFYSNFLNGNIGVHISSGWEAAGWAELFGVSVGGLSASVSGDLQGGHDASKGWWFSGKASGSAAAWGGCCGSGCSTKTCWGCCVDTYIAGEVCPCPCGLKICASVSVNASVSEKDGVSVGIDLF